MRELAIVRVRDGSVALPEAARVALGLIPGDPILMLPCADGLVLKRARPRAEEMGRHRAHPAAVIELGRAPAARQQISRPAAQ